MPMEIAPLREGVEYQAYYKIFKTGAMVISLALTPIWSAVTRAKA